MNERTPQSNPENLVDRSARRLGAFDVGPIAFGCWRMVDPHAETVGGLLDAAVEAGMNLIDTADIYGLSFGGGGFGVAEEILGAELARAPGRRDEIVLATKGGIVPGVPYDQSATYLRAACEASLRRLRVDRIDLYQVHRPDLFVHPEVLAATLGELRESGKVAEVGVSNLTVAQHRALLRYMDVPLVTTQPEFSLLHLDPLRDGLFDLCMECRVAPLVWSPLGGGRLATGEGASPTLLGVLDRLADREGVDRAAIALAFVLAHPARPVAIVGTQTPKRLAEMARALDVRLDRTDCYELLQAAEGLPLP